MSTHLTDEELQERQDLAAEAGKVFSPTAPIDERSLFAGREAQVFQVIDAINQKGQHVILFGERGVGKTSLANVLAQFLKMPAVLAPRVNCERNDTFDTVWRKVFEQIENQMYHRKAGFTDTPTQQLTLMGAELLLPAKDEKITTDNVRRALLILSQAALPIIIIDEFDRLPEEPKAVFADAIKALSDHAVSATVILVGVADSVDQLIEEHHSVERALVQVRMPRMSRVEIVTVVRKGLGRLGLTIADSALQRICALSQGLPHYTHLISLYAARHAIAQGSSMITDDVVEAAIMKALDGAQQSIRSDWHRATMSPRTDNLFSDVLLACALAATDELGYFAAKDVRAPIRQITGKPYDIPSFAQHLAEFCESKRGPILQRIGSRRGFRFRFVNPIMQPFVIMQGFRSRRLRREWLDQLKGGALRDGHDASEMAT